MIYYNANKEKRLGDTQIVKEDFVEAINNVLNSLIPQQVLLIPLA